MSHLNRRTLLKNSALAGAANPLLTRAYRAPFVVPQLA